MLFYFYMCDTISFCEQLVFHVLWFVNGKLIYFLPSTERREKNQFYKGSEILIISFSKQ